MRVSHADMDGVDGFRSWLCAAVAAVAVAAAGVVVATSSGAVSGGAPSPVSPGSRVCFGVAGASGDVAVVNLTPVSASAAGYGLLISSDVVDAPVASNVNFGPGSTDPNVAFAPIGADGRVCFVNSRHTTVELIADHLGTIAASDFTPANADATPKRTVDTRAGVGGDRLEANGRLCFSVAGAVRDVAVVNLTPVLAGGGGNGQLVSSDVADVPVASNVNFALGSADPNVAFAPIGADGTVCFVNSRHTSVDLVADHLGTIGSSVFTPANTAASPERVIDTRIGLGGSRLTESGRVCAGVAGQPGDLAAVNLTPVQAAGAGNGLLISSDIADPPVASNANFGLGTADPNVAFAPIGADGGVCFVNSRHTSVDLVADHLGTISVTAFTPANPDGTPRRVVDTRDGTIAAPTSTTTVPATTTTTTPPTSSTTTTEPTDPDAPLLMFGAFGGVDCADGDTLTFTAIAYGFFEAGDAFWFRIDEDAWQGPIYPASANDWDVWFDDGTIDLAVDVSPGPHTVTGQARRGGTATSTISDTANCAGATTTDCATVTTMPQIECEALVAIYHALDGPNWWSAGDWLHAPNPCMWVGVTCVSGHVTGLDLTFRSAAGAMPAEFGDLVHLQTFRSAGGTGGPSGITSLPAEIGNLTSLTDLNVVGNPMADLPAEFAELDALTTLHLTSAMLTFPDEIGGLASLQELVVWNPGFDSLPASIGNVTTLVTLDLRWRAPVGGLDPQLNNGTALSSLPPELGNLENLVTLNLRGEDLTSLPEEIGNLASLETLDVAHNQLAALPSSIGDLSSLTTLDATHNAMTSVPASLTALTGLSTLRLAWNELTALPSDIHDMTELEVLDVADNNIGSLPSAIGGLANLRQLILGAAFIGGTNSGFGGNPLTTLPAEIGDLTRLERLDAPYGDLTSLPAEMGNLVNLTWLDLRSNDLSVMGDITAPLLGLVGADALTTLDLSNNGCLTTTSTPLRTWLTALDSDWTSCPADHPLGTSVGGGHACHLLANGTAACVGRNDFGQLGHQGGTLAPVANLTGAVAVASGDMHSCAVRIDGSVACWGRNDDAQLGVLDGIARVVPFPVPGVADAVGVEAAGNLTCATISDGSLVCWGALLGSPDVWSVPTAPVPIDGIGDTVDRRDRPLVGVRSQRLRRGVVLGSQRRWSAR